MIIKNKLRRFYSITCIFFAVFLFFMHSPVSSATDELDFRSFQIWLEGISKTAKAKGISEKTLNKAFEDIKPIKRVIELDRRQPERTMTLSEYLERVVSEDKLRQGRELYLTYKPLTDSLYEKYKVPGHIIIAIWGMETNYGKNMGSYPVIHSLATLAWEGRRKDFFENELFIALKILEDGHISFDKMIGSWAGAMGQIQFMPSSFNRYSVDYNGDGKYDIWNSIEDSLASAANYLNANGWKDREPWGQELASEGLPEETGLDNRNPLSSYKKRNITGIDGSELRGSPDLSSAIVLPDGKNGRAFIVHNNFRAILRWNRSVFFGVAVGLMSDHIAAD